MVSIVLRQLHVGLFIYVVEFETEKLTDDVLLFKQLIFRLVFAYFENQFANIHQILAIHFHLEQIKLMRHMQSESETSVCSVSSGC